MVAPARPDAHRRLVHQRIDQPHLSGDPAIEHERTGIWCSEASGDLAAELGHWQPTGEKSALGHLLVRLSH